jgi:hypothetical protein
MGFFMEPLMAVAIFSLRSRLLMSFAFVRRIVGRRMLLELVEARIAAERRVAELYNRVPVASRTADRGFIARMIVLRQFSMMTNHELRHLSNAWHKASQHIHGEHRGAKRAVKAITALREQVARLDDANGYRKPVARSPKPVEVKVVGFARPEQKALSLVEAFGDAMLGKVVTA